MGLAERRAAKEFQDQIYPQWKEKLDAAAGRAIPVEIDWEALQAPDESHLYGEAWAKVYFEPLVGALRAIASDDLGRDAVRDGLHKIVIRHSGDKGIVFVGGALVIDLPPTTNIDDVRERQHDIQLLLERGL
ncbi:MAG TPA: hypothetical protein VKT76_12440 [Bradyrhizobium sp.]|nr:hypothetical protein [Bradyrhizobium sp.]